MRRTAVSIPANNLILAKDLGYGDTTLLNSLLEEVSRMLSAYASAILTSASGLLAPTSQRDIKGVARA